MNLWRAIFGPSARERVLACLEDGPHTGAEITKRTGIRARVYLILNALEEEGEVVSVPLLRDHSDPRRVYRLTVERAK